MRELVAVHALVELDPEAQQEIQRWRKRLERSSDEEREDIRIRLHRYEAGDELVVRIATTLELAGEERDEKRPGPTISGVWFSRDDPAGNSEHARRLVIQGIRRLLDELAQQGIDQRTAGLPVRLEYDEAVEAELGEPGRLASG